MSDRSCGHATYYGAGLNSSGDNGTGRRDAAFSHVGAINQRHVCAKPNPPIEVTARALLNSLLRNGFVQGIRVIVTSTHKIGPRSENCVVTNNNGTMLRRLNDGESAYADPPPNPNTTFFTRNHSAVGENYIVPDVNHVVGFGVPRIEKHALAENDIIPKRDPMRVSENDVCAEHDARTTPPKKSWPKYLS